MIHIVCGRDTQLLRTARKELKRYVYLLTHQVPAFTEEVPCGDALILCAEGDRYEKQFPVDGSRLRDDGYRIQSFCTGDSRAVVFYGKKDVAVLYAVYRFFELKGVRYYLHGDVIPETAPDLFTDISTEENPLFRIRGMLPYHDFAEGPDIWNREDYSLFVRQMAKMRCNLIEYHDYLAEPGVWYGDKKDITPEGNVLSSYPAHHFKTNGNAWGFQNFRTSQYWFDAPKLFDREMYCAPYMAYVADADYTGDKMDPEASVYRYNRLFDDFGDVLKENFELAHALGMKTAIGHQTPLTMLPSAAKHYGLSKPMTEEERIRMYEGAFERIKRKYPLDYFFLWTTEKFGWQRYDHTMYADTMEDMRCAVKAWENVGKPFYLGSCGWTLGPEDDRLAFDRILPAGGPMTAMNRQVGKSPVDPCFGDMGQVQRPGWVIPWAEDDPAMTIPQLWVGRIRKDVYDARRYGCEGILAVHWRTKNITHNLSALNDAAWDQHPWCDSINPRDSGEGYLNPASETVTFPDGTGSFRCGRKNSGGYAVEIGTGTYTVKLCFRNEAPSVTELRLISSFNRPALKRRLEIPAGEYSLEIPGIFVDDISVRIFLKDTAGENILCRVQIQGESTANQLGSSVCRREIDCGSAEDCKMYSEHYRNAPSEDFYVRWAETEFGSGISREAGHILAQLDGKLPRPVAWIFQSGPGLITKNQEPWEEVRKNYEFVDAFCGLRDRVTGQAQQQRFDYWADTFTLLRQLAETGCLWGAFAQACSENRKEDLLPVFEKILICMKRDVDKIMECVETKGDLGTMINLLQSSYGRLLPECYGEAEKRGIMLPEVPGTSYSGRKKTIVLTQPTGMKAGAFFALKFITLGGTEQVPQVYYRCLGETAFRTLPVRRVGEWIYRTEPFIPQDDFEYYIASECRFPAGNACSTVILD